MPISPIVLQRRHAELGRIRLGDKGGKGQPQKLTHFRITSPNERHIRDLAQLYGGEPRLWDNQGKNEWEVYTEATSIPVIVVKGGISQWMETWSGGGCVHRCDGVTNAETNEPCDPNDRPHQEAKPTTRLSVMLRELDAIGVFRLESHGWNSAAELPGLVELAMHVGEMVPANLYLAERKTIKDGRTNRFIVPGLDLEVSPARLAALVSGAGTRQAVVAGGEAPATAIGAAPEVNPLLNQGAKFETQWLTLAMDATTEEELRGIWNDAGERGALTDRLKEVITARAQEVQGFTAQEEPFQLSSEGDLEDTWFMVTAEAGKQGMTTSTLEADYEAFTGHPPSQATAEAAGRYLEHLRGVRA